MSFTEITSWWVASTECSAKSFWYICSALILYCLKRTKSLGNSEKTTFLILWGDWHHIWIPAMFYAQGEQLVLWLFPGQLIGLCNAQRKLWPQNILLCIWTLCFNLLYCFPFLFLLFVPQHVFRDFSKCYVCTCLQNKLVTDWKAEPPFLLSCSVKLRK